MKESETYSSLEHKVQLQDRSIAELERERGSFEKSMCQLSDELIQSRAEVEVLKDKLAGANGRHEELTYEAERLTAALEKMSATHKEIDIETFHKIERLTADNAVLLRFRNLFDRYCAEKQVNRFGTIELQVLWDKVVSASDETSEFDHPGDPLLKEKAALERDQERLLDDNHVLFGLLDSRINQIALPGREYEEWRRILDKRGELSGPLRERLAALEKVAEFVIRWKDGIMHFLSDSQCPELVQELSKTLAELAKLPPVTNQPLPSDEPVDYTSK